jgi:hypothetical protein
MKTNLRAVALGAVLAAYAAAQPAATPQTYSFTATNSMMGTALTVKVNRNGSKEVMEQASVANPSGFHTRVLYDFAAHRIYTVDLNSKICTTQVYESSYAPMFDPIGAAHEMVKDMASNPPRFTARENVNGIATKVAEIPLPQGQGKSKVWLDEKHNFVVKMAMAMGSAPAATLMEMRQLSYAPSPDSMFAAPSGCKEIGGVSNANGGRAEMSTEVKASGTQAPGKGPADQPRPAARPAAGGKVVSVRYRLVPESYSGRCPAAVQLVGEITTDGPGTVRYRFLAGAVAVNGAREGTVEFTSAGTKTVTRNGTFRTTPQVPHTSLLAAMQGGQSESGQNVTSGGVPYKVTCTGQ